ncbi:LLM class flavin-dependent oxidoreductase [Streptomyces griseorubiginosus]|uniref:LLM class flavin-dependent oxidoreductase n=1 Tax=Streptomyces griseorubiginosus TaxID=67304 RepID=UPI001AD7899D|nr:LLM class flavin-dependent oxidoreductase [Streptomyces griseorubiginosus]MBO4253317.1 LLM class flavin-dependent oxidoreductase [Streptomyces griseorubiginosus]
MIKPWLFEFFRAVNDPIGRDDPAAAHEHFRRYLDLWVDDEALGFEGIFFSEHHFGPGYSPSPNLVIANLAARTTSLRLGVLGTVSGYATPWRVAEEFAMLDHLTEGRLEMGVVSGIPPELAVVGISRERAAEMHAETLDVLLAAIAKPVVSHQGKQFSFEDVRITPGFLRPSPSVWTASTSEASARRAGSLGLKMCGGFSDVEKLLPVYEAYQDAARAAGMPTGPDQVGIRRQVMIVEDEADRERAGQLGREGIETHMRVSSEAMKVPDAAHMALDPDELIYGTPTQVADEIIRQCQALGVGNFVASFNIFDLDELRRNHELFGREVLPRLRAAEIG